MALLLIDHKPVCRGNKTCIECGRPGCNGCICTKDHPDHMLGKCVICAKLHKEEGITLHPMPSKEWDR